MRKLCDRAKIYGFYGKGDRENIEISKEDIEKVICEINDFREKRKKMGFGSESDDVL